MDHIALNVRSKLLTDSLAVLGRLYPADLLALAESCPLPAPVTRDAIQAAVGQMFQVFSLRADRVHHRLIREGRFAHAAAFYRDASPSDQQAILALTNDELIAYGRGAVTREGERNAADQKMADEALDREQEAQRAQDKVLRIQAERAERIKLAAEWESGRPARLEAERQESERRRAEYDRRQAEIAEARAKMLAEREAARNPSIAKAIATFAGGAIAKHLAQVAARHTAIRKCLKERGITASILQVEVNESPTLHGIKDKIADRAARAAAIPAARSPGLFAAAAKPDCGGRDDAYFVMDKTALASVYCNEAGITRHEIIAGWTGSRKWRRPVIDQFHVPLRQRLLYRQIRTAVRLADGAAIDLLAFARSAPGRRTWHPLAIRKLLPLIRDAETANACADALVAGITAVPAVGQRDDVMRHLARIAKLAPELAGPIAAALMANGVTDLSMRQLARIGKHTPLAWVA